MDAPDSGSQRAVTPMRLIACTLLLLLTACDYKVDSSTHYQLERQWWTCTRERIVSIKPYFTECVEYRMLR